MSGRKRLYYEDYSIKAYESIEFELSAIGTSKLLRFPLEQTCQKKFYVQSSKCFTVSRLVDVNCIILATEAEKADLR